MERLEAADNPAVIFRRIVGSHAYGTANALAEKIQAEIESGKGRLPVESDKARIDALIAEVMKVAEVA